MSTATTFGDYMTELAKGHHPAERVGQHAFNLLHVMHPALADEVRGEPYLDPFHNDDNLPSFFYYLVDEWDHF